MALFSKFSLGIDGSDCDQSFSSLDDWIDAGVFLRQEDATAPKACNIYFIVACSIPLAVQYCSYLRVVNKQTVITSIIPVITSII
jgi:hypothetical protein